MRVVGPNGEALGTVDHVEGDRIKLTRSGTADHQHHYAPLTHVTRVDDAVHLSVIPAGLVGAAGAAAGAAGAHAAGHHGPGETLLPPVKNRAVDGAKPRKNYYLPWIVGIIGLILLYLLVRQLIEQGDGNPEPAPSDAAAVTAPAVPATGGAALPVESIGLPNGQTVQLEPGSLNFTLQQYLASQEAAPRTFQFDKLNFDTGSAAIRPIDQPNIDALAQILSAYPNARVQITGYTDARGSEGANDQLGAQRAQAVVAALTAKGIDASRVQTATGGETNPTDTNASAEGQFENRRTELTVTAK